MLFNSIIFVIYAILFFILLPVFNRLKNNFRWIFITISSFIFYGWWDWRFIFLIIFSGLIDFFSGILIKRVPKFKKLFLIFSLFGNLGTLAIFKYSKFFAENIDYLFSSLNIQLHLQNNIPEFMLILPVGISFYTFQSMSYTIDIYRGRLKPTFNIFHFFSYLALFPQLVAGPIVRAKDLLPQLTRVKKVSNIESWNGLKLIIIGYFKKVVLADNIAELVNYGFNSSQITQSSLFWWITVLGFAFQIYFDFSGYSDIARGLAKWMGLNFRINFNHPYISKSLKEFWTRWHISLSSWFRDYVYIPMGGSKKGKFSSHLNMWITMIVSGFWHGASWTFVIWGALHAFFLSLERIIKWNKIPLIKHLVLIIVLFQVLIAWVFFRASSFSQAIGIIKVMLSFNTNMNFTLNINSLFYIVLAALIELWFVLKLNKIHFLNKKTKNILDFVYIILLIVLIILFRGKGQEFIYFQF